MYQVIKLPSQRRHTHAYLHCVQRHNQIYLQTEIEASALLDYRKQNPSMGCLACVIYAISQVLKHYPRANSYYRRVWGGKIVEYPHVYAKFTLDKYLSNERIVLSGMVPQADTMTIAHIQQCITAAKNADPADPEYGRGPKLLHQLPLPLGKRLMAAVLRQPEKALMRQGTFAISSLGKSDICGFFPITTTTLGFGVAKIQAKVIARGKTMVAVPHLPVTMCFDHRVIDGAIAADILDQIKSTLQHLALGEPHV